MSHTMNIKLNLTDNEALKKACTRLSITQDVGRFNLFGSVEEGTAVRLDGWRYPVVVKADGSVAYDNYNGRWGDIEKLHELEATYGFEKAKSESILKGYLTQEIEEGDEIILKVMVGD